MAIRLVRAVVLSLLLLLVFSVLPVYASAQEPNEWAVPGIGTMKGPDGFRVFDIDKAIKEYEAKQAQERKNKPQAKPPVPGSPPVQKAWNDLKLYQLQVNDGKVFRVAYAMVVKDTKNTYPGMAAFFNQELTDGQQDQLALLNKQLQQWIELVRIELKKRDIADLQALDVQYVSRLKRAPEPIYTMSGRFIGDVSGFLVPVYAKGYVLLREGVPVYILVVANDSEGKYWAKTADQLLNSLH